MSDTLTLPDVQRRTAVPEEKITAILAVFDQVLFTESDEAAQIVAQMRGRRGRRQPLTFGELVGLADKDKISAAAVAIGIDDLGAGPPVDLARALGFIAHPAIDVCEACNRYAISTEGGVVKLLTEGRCPHCEKGLLSAPEQEQPYIAWTTLTEMAPAVTHDRETIPHLPLPTRNDTIREGQDWYSVSAVVTEACHAEGLMDGERINLAHLCAFLFHGPLKDRFDGAEQVLVTLEDPSRIGVYDETSMRAIVRQAKEWELKGKPAAPSAPAARPPFTISGNANTELSKLLVACFEDGAALRNFVRGLPNGPSIASRIDFSGSLTAVAHNVAGSVIRGAVHPIEPFYEGLIRECPQHRYRIEDVWLVIDGPRTDSSWLDQDLDWSGNDHRPLALVARLANLITHAYGISQYLGRLGIRSSMELEYGTADRFWLEVVRQAGERTVLTSSGEHKALRVLLEALRSGDYSRYASGHYELAGWID